MGGQSSLHEAPASTPSAILPLHSDLPLNPKLNIDLTPATSSPISLPPISHLSQGRTAAPRATGATARAPRVSSHTSTSTSQWLGTKHQMRHLMPNLPSKDAGCPITTATLQHPATALLMSWRRPRKQRLLRGEAQLEEKLADPLVAGIRVKMSSMAITTSVRGQDLETPRDHGQDGRAQARDHVSRLAHPHD